MAGGSVDAMARRQTGKIARTTANALKALPDSWVVLHDVRWPGRPFASIDHIAVGPGGIFVIDSNGCSGQVQVSGGALRLNGRLRERELLTVREATAAISRRLGHVPESWMTPVLCMVGSHAGGWAGPVAVCDKANLVETLTSRPPVLSPEVVHSVVNDLRLRLHTDPPASRVPAPGAVSPRWKRGRRAQDRPSLAAPVAAVAVVASLAISPAVVTGVVEGIGGLFTQTIDSGSMAPGDPEMSDRP